MAGPTYQASQGWPFPSGLMVGFRATALTEAVTPDGEEVLEACWSPEPSSASMPPPAAA